MPCFLRFVSAKEMQLKRCFNNITRQYLRNKKIKIIFLEKIWCFPFLYANFFFQDNCDLGKTEFQKAIYSRRLFWAEIKNVLRILFLDQRGSFEPFIRSARSSGRRSNLSFLKMWQLHGTQTIIVGSFSKYRFIIVSKFTKQLNFL